MPWDFNRPMPEIVIFETKSDIPERFIANFIDREGTDKDPRRVMVWEIRTTGRTAEEAADKLTRFWSREAAAQASREEAARQRAAAREAARTRPDLGREIA